MKKLFIESLNAFLFIDELKNPEEKDRIKVWDSNHEYIDYFPIETLIDAAAGCNKTLEDEYNTRCLAIESATDINELIGIVSTDEFIIAPTSDMRPIWKDYFSADTSNESVEEALNWSMAEQIKFLRLMYDVNFIGNYALLNKDAR